MAYQVDITDPALIDAEEYARFIGQVGKDPEAAARWFRGLVAAIYSLEELPERLPVIPEAGEFDEDIRHLIYHSHRVVFHVDRARKRVVVYRVYHAARRDLTHEDLGPLNG